MLKPILVLLWSASWLMEVGGVLLIVADIRADHRAARQARTADDQIGQITSVTSHTDTDHITISGLPGVLMGQGRARDEQFRAFIDDRLTSGSRRRWIGVVLILAGSTVGYVANLISLQL